MDRELKWNPVSVNFTGSGQELANAQRGFEQLSRDAANYLNRLDKQEELELQKEKEKQRLELQQAANTRAENQALRLKTADELAEKQRLAESAYNTVLLDKNVYRPGGITEGVEANKEVMKNLNLSATGMDSGVDASKFKKLKLEGPNTLTNVTNKLALDYANTSKIPGTSKYTDVEGNTRFSRTDEEEAKYQAGLDSYLKTKLGDADYNRYKANEEYQLKIGKDLVNDPRFKANTVEKFDLAKQALLDAGGNVTNEIADQGMQAQARELTLRTAERDKRQKALDTANKAIAEATIDELKAKGDDGTGKYGSLTSILNSADTTGNSKDVKDKIGRAHV